MNRNLSKLIGFMVKAVDGAVGTIEQFYFDDLTWNRMVLVSPQWIKSLSWADQKIFVDLSRDIIKNSPEFDPSKPVSRDHENKLLKHLQKPDTTEWVVFKFHAPPEAEVYVAGTFNNWDPTAIRLGDNGKGAYTATVLLPLGTYEYKFIVNGEWHTGADDREQVPNPFGSTNNVLVVKRGTTHTSHLRAFSRMPVSEDRPLYTSPLGG